MTEPPVVVVSAVALSEKVPDPALRPSSFALRQGDLLDLDEVGGDLVAAGYERVDQVDDRGQFAIRGGILDVYPATEEHAVRVDLFDIEIESLRWFSTFTQRSLGRRTSSRSRRPPSWRRSTASWRRSPRSPTRRTGRTSPSCCRSTASTRSWTSPPPTPAWSSPPRRRSAPRSPTTGRTSCAAFHDADAHHLYVKPDEIQAALDARAHVRLSLAVARTSRSSSARRPPTSPRARCARPSRELEKLVRSGYRTVVAWPRRGEGERTAYNLARLKAHWLGEDRAPEG